MTTDSLAEQLKSLIANIVIDLEARKVILISPENVANEVDRKIDPDNVSPALKTYASIMQIRQATREYLRKKHDPVEKMEDALNTGMGDMFSDELQHRYPVKRGNDRLYCLLEYMEDEDFDFNFNRMTKAGQKIISHANALMAYKVSRKKPEKSA